MYVIALKGMLMHNMIYRKMAIDRAVQTTIRARSTSPRARGLNSRPSRNRYVIPMTRFGKAHLFSKFWEIKQNHYDTVC